ncbi:MAG: DinB family protein [Ferruginibacter sp.]
MKIIEKPVDKEFQSNEPMFATLISSDGELLKHLTVNLETTKKLILSLSPEKLLYKYAEGKWTIKEVIMHLVEMERIYSYRALRFARNDQAALPGFDADKYINFSGANERDVVSLLEEFTAVRQSAIALLNGLTDEALARSGVMNGYSVSVRALAYHIAGHELHHINIIKERYLG